MKSIRVTEWKLNFFTVIDSNQTRDNFSVVTDISISWPN